MKKILHPPTCHPTEKYFAKNLCKSCYNKLYEKTHYIPKPKNIPTCHTNKSYKAKGLCNECYKKQYREINFESIANKAKDYWKKNKEKLRSYRKNWGIKNKEYLHLYETRLRPNKKERLEYSKQYQTNKPESHRKASYKWAMSPSGRVAASTRRALKVSTSDGTVTTKSILSMFDSQHGLCKNSRCKVKLDDGYHIDHMTPLSKGGKHIISNIQLVCPYCNLTKGIKVFCYL